MQNNGFIIWECALHTDYQWRQPAKPILGSASYIWSCVFLAAHSIFMHILHVWKIIYIYICVCVCAHISLSLSLSFPLSIMYTLISERMCIMDYNINSTKPRMHVNMRDCWSQPGPCTKRQESSGRYKGILQKMVKPHSRSRMVKHGMFSSCQPIHVYIYIYM